MSLGSALESSLAGMAAVCLSDLDEAAALAHRVDVKYLVPAAVTVDLLATLRSTHRCLLIAGSRTFRYRSTYVDSPDLSCFHDHRRGVRRRWKARTRVYEDSGQARWEVKLKDGRGLTVKHALPLAADPGGQLTDPMRAFLDDVVGLHYRLAPPRSLAPRLTVRYRRSTLTDLVAGTRVTIDSDLTMVSDRGSAQLAPGLVLVETKSFTGRARADEVLRSLAMRPRSVSKYCAGIALLEPGLPAHPWRQLLRDSFVSAPPGADHQREEIAA